eukprot:m.225509 g.225509  ORF g.225509 m.225509 type:complete len:82 (-) comp16706_c0_seq1:656-901(-)
MARGHQKLQSQAKAQEKARAAKGAVSQLKVNEKAMTIQCKVCLQTFLCTTKKPELEEHVANKHGKKGFDECFPGYGAGPAS